MVMPLPPHVLIDVFVLAVWLVKMLHVCRENSQIVKTRKYNSLLLVVIVFLCPRFGFDLTGVPVLTIVT